MTTENRNLILSAPLPAFGLRDLSATRTGQTHRESYIPAREAGFMYIVSDDCVGYPVAKVTVAEAREQYARHRADGWIKMDATITFLGTDYCGRYVYREDDKDRRTVTEYECGRCGNDCSGECDAPTRNHFDV